MLQFRPLILIPSYNSGATLRQTITSYLPFGIPVWVVIDGSTDNSSLQIESLQTTHQDQFRILYLAINSGKGAAILHGLKEALAAGFTHILTTEAEGQHPANSVPQFLALSHAQPEAAILGRPFSDSPTPLLRTNYQTIANFCANLQTLGWGIDDAQFGMRLYPAKDLMAVFDSTNFARRCDFNPETAVRLAWLGVPVINLPTPAHHPFQQDATSSCVQKLRNLLLLSFMQLRLFAGFLIRLPFLLSRAGNPLESLSPPTS